jgi:hypothetical protein
LRRDGDVWLPTSSLELSFAASFGVYNRPPSGRVLAELVNLGINVMKKLPILRALILTSIFSCVASRCEADERLSAVQSALSSTTISGYVDTSTHRNSNTNASAPGFAGTWIGILTERTATNRVEIYVVVDEVGNFAGRGMNFDRTLGSAQIEGTLDRRGRAQVGQTRFYFNRNGVATVIGRGESGRYFSAQLLREQIR